MKAQELRIGNYVNINLKTIDDIRIVINKPMKNPHVICLETGKITVCSGDYVHTFRCENLEPIPLDKQFLKMFGFKDLDYKEGYIGIDVKYPSGFTADFVLTKPEILGEWQKYYVFEFSTGHLSRFVELKFVNQLQNLFNSITGQELTI